MQHCVFAVVFTHTYTYTYSLLILTTNDIPSDVYPKIDLLILQLVGIYIVILIILFTVIKMLHLHVLICKCFYGLCTCRDSKMNLNHSNEVDETGAYYTE